MIAVFALSRGNVRDHLPLKEGLRQLFASSSAISGTEVRDHLPLKEGLRLDRFGGQIGGCDRQSETIFH